MRDCIIDGGVPSPPFSKMIIESEVSFSRTQSIFWVYVLEIYSKYVST